MKTCKHCGKALPAGRRKFCSDECAHSFWADEAKRERDSRCVVCGEPLPPRARYYCSAACQRAGKGLGKVRIRSHVKRSDQYSREENATIDICLNCTKRYCPGSCELMKKKKT